MLYRYLARSSRILKYDRESRKNRSCVQVAQPHKERERQTQQERTENRTYRRSLALVLLDTCASAWFCRVTTFPLSFRSLSSSSACHISVYERSVLRETRRLFRRHKQISNNNSRHNFQETQTENGGSRREGKDSIAYQTHNRYQSRNRCRWPDLQASFPSFVSCASSS